MWLLHFQYAVSADKAEFTMYNVLFMLTKIILGAFQRSQHVIEHHKKDVL